MGTTHALLSPSSASRWLQCTPSARLEAKFPDRAGEAADEGTLAHKLSELMLGYALKKIDKTTFLNKTTVVKKNKLYGGAAMWEYCEQFRDFVLAKYNEALERSKDAVIFLEQSVDLSHIIPEGHGTRDVAIIASGLLDVIDLKYGKGVEVSAEENEQLMLYGAGTLEEFAPLYDIDTVRLSIFQPRIDNYSTWEISADDLTEWTNTIVSVKAKLAFAGKGKLIAGEHCTFCRAKVGCKALHDYNMEAAVRAFEEPALLSDKELVEIFKKAASLKSWLNTVEAYMLERALKDKKWPGLKLVSGKSSRSVGNEVKAIATLKANKIRPALYLSEPKLLGITALEKNIGGARLNKLIGRLIIKPEGNPALVKKDDPRPEFHSAESARKVFTKTTKTKKR